MMDHFLGKDVEFLDICMDKKDGRSNGQDLALLKRYQEIIYILKIRILNNSKSLYLWLSNSEKRARFS